MAFHIIVFDEAQAVKNILADTTGAVRRLTGRFKLTLTGTPLENHLGEYFSIIDLCMPGLLGEYDRFKPQSQAGRGPRAGSVTSPDQALHLAPDEGRDSP